MTISTQYENFIGVYDDAFSPEFCDTLIEYFEWSQKINRTYGRQEQESVKKDNSCNMNPTDSVAISFAHPNISGFLGEFNDTFWNVCYADYLRTYSVLSGYDQHTVYTYKIQKTQPGGGYHAVSYTHLTLPTNREV